MATRKHSSGSVAQKNIGIEVSSKPTEPSNDPRCPFYGKLRIRGRQFVGTVTSDKMQRTATVMWERQRALAKYERYEKRLTKIHAHNPDSIGAKKGDRVLVAETRPLSKTKNFVIVEKLGKDVDYEIKSQSILADAESSKSQKAGKADKKAEAAKAEAKKKSQSEARQPEQSAKHGKSADALAELSESHELTELNESDEPNELIGADEDGADEDGADEDGADEDGVNEDEDMKEGN